MLMFYRNAFSELLSYSIISLPNKLNYLPLRIKVSEFGYITMEMTQNEDQRPTMYRASVVENTEEFHMCIIGVPEREERGESQRTFKKNGLKFLNLVKNTNCQIQDL